MSSDTDESPILSLPSNPPALLGTGGGALAPGEETEAERSSGDAVPGRLHSGAACFDLQVLRGHWTAQLWLVGQAILYKV